MNLKQSIKKILKEETSQDELQQNIVIVNDFIKTFFPNFNKKNVIITRSTSFETWYFYDQKGTRIAEYRHYDRELILNRDVFYLLENYLGENMTYVIDWFNNEFGFSAENVTF